jgi:BRCT domain type II-containing protein
MEILIGIAIIIAFVVVWFTRKPKELVEAENAPYKVETPAVEVDQVTVVAAAEASAIEVPAKKTRKPRAPKAEKAVTKAPKVKSVETAAKLKRAAKLKNS